MKTLRLFAFALLGGVLLLGGLATTGWLVNDWGQPNPGDLWDTDGPPSTSVMKWLSDSGYPPSISRVVEKGVSHSFNGDYDHLMILCFPLADLELMKRALAPSETWDSGFPTDMNWRHQIESRAPADLMISNAAPPSSFIHVHVPTDQAAMNRRWAIIDVTRGISYRIIIQT